MRHNEAEVSTAESSDFLPEIELLCAMRKRSEK